MNYSEYIQFLESVFAFVKTKPARKKIPTMNNIKL